VRPTAHMINLLEILSMPYMLIMNNRLTEIEKSSDNILNNFVKSKPAPTNKNIVRMIDNSKVNISRSESLIASITACIDEFPKVKYVLKHDKVVGLIVHSQ